MEKDLKTIESEALQEVQKTQNSGELEAVSRKYLGRNGALSGVFSFFKSLSPEQRSQLGKEANLVKQIITKAVSEKRHFFLGNQKEDDGSFDCSSPGITSPRGNLHPLTQIRRDIEFIFQKMGFHIAAGPEMEDEYRNFDALNVPADHPARDMWDTLWIKSKGKRMLLRTHTSPVQIRYMENHQPPFRIISPGKVFRFEATDASHEIQFYQVEGLLMDKQLSVADFVGITQEFFRQFFEKDIKVRLRPSFFPFTEPSFEVDINCYFCRGKGCKVCSHSGWIEVMGAGMVHPKVLHSVGYDSQQWKGFAFGMGMDRLAMMKYVIDDVRLFHSADLRFLKQF